MGTQKNRLNETVLLSTQNMFKLMGKKIFTILRSTLLFISAYDSLLQVVTMRDQDQEVKKKW